MLLMICVMFYLSDLNVISNALELYHHYIFSDYAADFETLQKSFRFPKGILNPSRVGGTRTAVSQRNAAV